MAVGPNTIYQVAARWILWGQNLMNVWHYRVETTGSEDNEYLLGVALANKLKADEVTAGTPFADLPLCVTQDCELYDFTVQCVWPIRYAFTVRPIETGGDRGANQYPNVQTSVTKRTTKAGRHFIGAMHLPPGGAEDYVDGLLTDAFKDAVSGFTEWLYTDYVETVTGTTFRPVIFHGGTLVPVYTDIFAREVQPQARVMVRRTVGRGI